VQVFVTRILSAAGGGTETVTERAA
jgi:hypothetical protein